MAPPLSAVLPLRSLRLSFSQSLVHNLVSYWIRHYLEYEVCFLFQIKFILSHLRSVRLYISCTADAGAIKMEEMLAQIYRDLRSSCFPTKRHVTQKWVCIMFLLIDSMLKWMFFMINLPTLIFLELFNVIRR